MSEKKAHIHNEKDNVVVALATLKKGDVVAFTRRGARTSVRVIEDVPFGHKVAIAPVKALPVAKVQLKNPTLIVGGAKIVFPVTLESGQYIEMESAEDCALRDERGALVQKVTPVGEVPVVVAGEMQKELVRIL
jgi:acyl-CoA synthetase (AMP-forming)/AMP-acid ligase II